ncbi:hypothetical protein F4778DRAFT_720057 [Xylariomycetidae sp. FL2044]|nr:hypothetical protein F4778DRAFT_720057 [Xylariomycetidae sp. FL2044]
MSSFKSVAVAAVWSCLTLSGTHAVQLPYNAEQLFNESMFFMDKIYDRKVGYLNYFYYPLAAGPHETRSSVWYATGLLQRNQGDDVEQAIRIIENVIAAQHSDPSELWYGDYQFYPEEPTVGTNAYPAVPYGSWDPNWRGFIGTNLIVIYEEFQSLLPNRTQGLILESLYNCTVGDGYRDTGFGSGLLNPGYTNPSVMRAVQASWVGRKMNDQNMTDYGEDWGRQVIDLYDLYDTLSEFNTATYYGVSIYALTMWAKYLPADSVLAQNAPRMIKGVWESIGQFYNANLKNLAGPWDRSYGYDLTQYVGLLSVYIWSLVGKEYAPVYENVYTMAHADDFQYAPLIAVLAPYHDALVPEGVVQKLCHFPGDHLVTASAYAPPVDAVQRNITSWLSANLTIGAMSFEDVEEASTHSSQWNAAVVQWARADGSVGYLTLAAGQEHALAAEAGDGFMNLTYPRGRQNSTFSFIVAQNPLGAATRDIDSLADISGLSVKASGTIDPEPIVSFCGVSGGDCDTRFGFEFWNLTFTMPNATSNSSVLPNLYLEIELA